MIEQFRGMANEKNWPSGVYFLGEEFSTTIVVIHQLPRTSETLWLRILGKGTVQKQAINELAALPADDPLRVNTLELLYNLRTILEANQPLELEDQELIMELSPLYLGRLDEAVQQWVQQGERLVIENLLQFRFGTLNEELRSIINPLLALPPDECPQLLS